MTITPDVLLFLMAVGFGSLVTGLVLVLRERGR